MDDFLHDDDQGGSIFESFTDVALCTLVVALLLVSLLAISITRSLNVEINRSKFSGGVMRPSIHLECTVPDFSETTSAEFAMERVLFSGQPYVAVHLFSPSLALIATDVRGGGTVALGEDETFAQQQDLSLYQFTQLAPGISPGSFEADGAETALLIPSILDKQMVYEPVGEVGYRVNADRRLTKRVLEALWPIYERPIYTARRPEEYSQARTRVYVETRSVEYAGEELHYVVIGHSSYKLPDALDDGSLAWLGGFSSGLTEIVFLGEAWSDAEKRTNRRILYFERQGYTEAAAAYREYAFPVEPLSGAALRAYDALVSAGESEAEARHRARAAVAQAELSTAALNERLFLDELDAVPPLLAYPQAWADYVRHFEEVQPEPPKWFYGEFLDRLGFDRLAIEGARR